MDKNNSVLCFGGLHFDRIARCLDDFQPAASNPVRVQSAPGGVANNIARTLSNLGVRVGLASLLGEDSDAEQLLVGLKRCGIDGSLTRQRSGLTTAGYTAVLGQDGELALGLADMEIYDAFTPAHLDKILEPSLGSDWWLAEANLPADTLAHLGAHKRGQIFCEAPVSPSKAVRWRGNLRPVDLFAGNRREAAVLAEIEINTATDAAAAARVLQSQGPNLVIITLGPDGVVMAAGDDCGYWPTPPTTVQDVNGAGDALYAGFIAARLNAAPPEQALAQGIALASLTAEQPGAVIGLKQEALRNRMAQITVPTTL